MQSEIIWESGRVKRWHAFHIIGEQNVADHAWGVAVTVTEIAEKHLSVPLMKAALFHDSAEFFAAGDVPQQAKTKWPGLSTIIERMEVQVDRELGIHVELPVIEKKILKWADTFELLMFAKHQLELGNRYVASMYRNCYHALTDTPTQSAYELLRRVANGGE